MVAGSVPISWVKLYSTTNSLNFLFLLGLTLHFSHNGVVVWVGAADPCVPSVASSRQAPAKPCDCQVALSPVLRPQRPYKGR